MLGVIMSGFAATQLPSAQPVTNDIVAVAVYNGTNREQLIATVGTSISIEVVCSALAMGGLPGMGLVALGAGI